MSKASFQSRITLDGGYSTDSEMKVWDCNTTFVDYDGVFTGLDIAVGDVIAVDTTMYEPGTFTLYSVTRIVTPDATNPGLEITYMEANDNGWGPPSLDSIFGAAQTIARPSTKVGLLPVVSRDTQAVSDKYTEYVQNYNFTKILDDILGNIASGAGGGASSTFKKINADNITLMGGMPVVIQTAVSSTVVRASSSNAVLTAVAGIVADQTIIINSEGTIMSQGVFEQAAYLWDNVTGGVGGLEGGKDYFLGNIDGRIVTTPPDTGFIVKIGKAISPTVMNVDVEPPIKL